MPAAVPQRGRLAVVVEKQHYVLAHQAERLRPVPELVERGQRLWSVSLFGSEALTRLGTESLQTPRWNEPDSNFQFRAGDGFGFSLRGAHRCAFGLMPPRSECRACRS
jgi:hypothetical protein